MSEASGPRVSGCIRAPRFTFDRTPRGLPYFIGGSGYSRGRRCQSEMKQCGVLCACLTDTVHQGTGARGSMGCTCDVRRASVHAGVVLSCLDTPLDLELHLSCNTKVENEPVFTVTQSN